MYEPIDKNLLAIPDPPGCLSVKFNDDEVSFNKEREIDGIDFVCLVPLTKFKNVRLSNRLVFIQ